MFMDKFNPVVYIVVVQYFEKSKHVCLKSSYGSRIEPIYLSGII